MAKKKNLYFTKVHEDAIVQYARTNDIKIRTELYIEYIQPAFSEMVDKIIYTYRFTSLPNIDVLKDECKIWLTTILDKYDPNKGSKAFSYFSVITKNWFIHKVRKTNQSNKREVQIDDLPKNIDMSKVVVENEYHSVREEHEFWKNLWEEINHWEKAINMKPNEEKVYEAIRMLLSSPDCIEIYNKKAIYFYIREITGLNTKQVVNNLNKMRVRYRVFKKKWDRGEI
jgi:DNA-directed RNA polymerase specialized sigma subunit